MQKIDFSWRKGFDVALLVSELNKGRKQEDKKVTYVNSQIEDYISAFETGLTYAAPVQSVHISSIISRALFRPTQSGKLSPKSILNLISDEYSKYFKLKLHDYYLVTSLSYRGKMPIGRWKIDDCLISFGVRGEKFYKKTGGRGRQSISDRLRQYNVPSQKGNYPIVIVRSKARDDRAAFHKMMEALDLARAILNLRINDKIYRRISSGRQPINAIRLGPVHTLHKGNGDLIEDFWYDPDFTEQTFLKNITEEIQIKYIKYWQRVLSRSPLRNELRFALIQYGRALDNPDPFRGFQELWAVLEYLSVTEPGDKYEVTLRRTSSLYRQDRLQYELLNHLRFRRNRLVHFSIGERTTSRQGELFICQAKAFVESFLWFYASHGKRFKDRGEVAEFLDIRQKLGSFGKTKRIMKIAEQLYDWTGA